MPTRQFIGKTVDEATDLALETLDLNREEVEIVVVNPGRSGILGFGGEPAEIHVTPIEEEDEETSRVDEPPSSSEDGREAESDQEDRSGPSRGRQGRRGRGRRGRGRGGADSRPDDAPTDAPPAMRDDVRPAMRHDDAPTDAPPAMRDDVRPAMRHDDAPTDAPPAMRDDVRPAMRHDDAPTDAPPAMRDDVRPAMRDQDSADGEAEAAHDGPDSVQTDVSEESKPRRREERVHTPGPDPEVEPVAAEVLDYFLSVMDVSVTTYVSEDSDDCDVAFEIEGEDSGLLIGRRGETLQALQFLVNMVINKKMERPAYITIDVEGYRERRQDALKDSAERAAETALSSGSSQTLQPMNAADRRIVHMALADHPDVETQSRGQGEQRRVVVQLKS